MKPICFRNSILLNHRFINDIILPTHCISYLRVCILVLTIVLASCNTKEAQEKTKVWTATAPAGNQYTRIDRQGTTVIPNGRLITPLGKQITVAPHPFGLTISPDGKTIITANSGVGPFSISIIKDYNSASPLLKQIPETLNPEEGLLEAVFMGLAISPDNQKVYVAG